MTILEHPDYGCEHEFPNDWIFGGADGIHPGSDPRWVPTIYEYMDEKLVTVHSTVVPVCDEEAFDYFTQVAEWRLTPVYIAKHKPGEKVELIPVKYNEKEDTFYDFVLPGT